MSEISLYDLTGLTTLIQKVEALVGATGRPIRVTLDESAIDCSPATTLEKDRAKTPACKTTDEELGPVLGELSTGAGSAVITHNNGMMVVIYKNSYPELEGDAICIDTGTLMETPIGELAKAYSGDFILPVY
ncbi:MAG: hypothetical protein WCI79_02710 [Candidatus Saccharibacteria bacterium]